MKKFGLALHQSADLLKREFERAARPSGLTLMQWRVLGTLTEYEPCSQKFIAEKTMSSTMTISDVVERLEKLGLIKREIDPNDSRAKLVSLTNIGKEKTQNIREIATQVYQKALVGISDENREITLQTLNKIAENLENE